MKRIAVAVLLAIAPFCAAHAAEPTGHYRVRGKDPNDGASYSGTVDVTRTGDTFKVVWRIEGTTYVGTGIGNDRFIAVSYKSGSNSGLALYGDKGENWDGIWTYSGGTHIGTEVWMRE